MTPVGRARRPKESSVEKHDRRSSGGSGAGTIQPTALDIYSEVQRGAAFREVRRRYRRFAFPAAAAFLLWYLAYVVTAIAAPGLMARQVAGALNVAMVAGLAQFATTFLLTWAYARHARLHRDPAALELRWAVTLETRQDPVPVPGLPSARRADVPALPSRGEHR
ncbi:DUF485 domain-containing protein [Streptomyces roseoverticillatus]|nr:DUF485 domain-containing protein [Streptomyces roseoverticillatus]MCF3105245.1 DUF485 domain-containing protein [Streptomyces roseoverticillatus]